MKRNERKSTNLSVLADGSEVITHLTFVVGDEFIHACHEFLFRSKEQSIGCILEDKKKFNT